MFYSNYGSFGAVLLTDRQTDKQTNRQRRKHNSLGGGKSVLIYKADCLYVNIFVTGKFGCLMVNPTAWLVR